MVVEKVVSEQQLEGLMPVVATCGTGPVGGGAKMAFFQGEPQVMRLVSTFSLQQAWRGQPQILEIFVTSRPVNASSAWAEQSGMLTHTSPR